MKKVNEKKCCFCGAPLNEFSNSPYPVVKDEHARCCDTCNNTIVFPIRFSLQINGLKWENEKK